MPSLDSVIRMICLMVSLLFKFGAFLMAGAFASLIISRMNDAHEDLIVTASRAVIAAFIFYLVVSVRNDIRIK